MLYEGIRFNMEQLRGMVHGLVEETRRDSMELMMLRMNAEGEPAVLGIQRVSGP